MEDRPTQGGIGTPSEEDISRIIRDTVESWKPQRGPDWTDVMTRLASTGPPAWLLYTAASAALVLILITAFLVGSALHIGALAPQEIRSHLP